MRIPDQIIEQIRHDTDIVEVISDFVVLKKRGRNFLGLCPFHNEKTPSFNVLPEKGIFKCFGCGKGGDAITFLREHQKISYPEALKLLAERLGISLPDDTDDHAQGESNRYENAYNVLRLAGNFFYKNLYADIGSEALQYVRLRGFSEETVKKFALGFSPDSFSATISELKALGVSEEALLDAGLVGKKEETGRVYDRFRGRLMFPIQNPTGRVIGFGGRRMNDEDTASAKYLNSPQSLVYNKSEVLYGIFQAKDALRQLGYAILVEGYADLLSVHQAGFQNVVASSGTALTKEQLRLLSRFCKRIKIVYDSDKAGINAALRGLDLAVSEGFDVEIVRLPDGDDPDSIIQHDGKEAFQRRLEEALSLVDFKGEIFREQGLLATPTGSTEAVRSIMETIAKVPIQIKRDFMIRSVAHRFSLREADLYAELTQILRRNQFVDAKERSQMRLQEPSNPEPPPFEIDTNAAKRTTISVVNSQSAGDISADKYSQQTASTTAPIHDAFTLPPGKTLLPEEEELLRIALTIEGACAYMKKKEGVSEEFFITNEAKALFLLIDGASQYGKPLDYLLKSSAQGDDVPSGIMGLVIRPENPSEGWQKLGAEISQDNVRIMYDCITRLKIRTLEIQIETLQTQHNTLYSSGSIEETFQIIATMQELDKTKREMLSHLMR
jgi:DNA primase